MITNFIWMIWVLAAGLLIFLLLDWIRVYNFFIALKTEVLRKYGDIDAIMQQRKDMLNALGPIVRKYDVHEYGAIKNTIEARGGTRNKNGPIVQEALKGLNIPNINALVEDYPDLKANELHLSIIGPGSISEVEFKLKEARLSYNTSAEKYNRVIKTFPMNIVATIHGFLQFDYINLNNKVNLSEDEEVEEYDPSEILNPKSSDKNGSDKNDR